MFISGSKSLNLPQTFLNGLVFISSLQNIGSHALKIPLRHRSQTSVKGVTTFDNGYWFTELTVGSSDPVELLIDTGSADLVLNPGLYKPSKDSKDLDTTFVDTYGTTTGASAGSTSEIITGSLYNDTVVFQSFTLHNQTIGTVNSNSTNGTVNNIYPHNGIIGLGDPSFSGSNSTPFFDNACAQNLVDECRFGLALGTNGTGSLTLGSLDAEYVPGGDSSLTKVPIVQEWFVFGDVTVDGKIVSKDALLEFDSGTSGIIGPISEISALFNQTGIQSVLQSTSSGDTLVGYYPCDKPPTIGLSLPSQSNITSSASSSLPNISNSSKIFNIASAALVQDKNNNNCTASISGFDFDYPGLWVLGQAFFQEKYIDHNLVNGSLGFVSLETNTSSTATSTSSSSSPSATHFASAASRSSFSVITLACLFMSLATPLIGW